jgi:sulfopyruvate decarboxylase subunit alpha
LREIFRKSVVLSPRCGSVIHISSQQTEKNQRNKITMAIDDPINAAALIVAGLKKAGIDFVATLPDEKMLEVIRAVETDRELKHVPLCREEEGIGICAGAYLAGKKTAIIMQNAGFLNSCNALTTTSLQFQIPILMLIYYAGDIGDRGFTTLGSVTEPVLQAMGFRSYVLRRQDDIDETLSGAQILADDSKKPVAVLLTKSVLGVK